MGPNNNLGQGLSLPLSPASWQKLTVTPNIVGLFSAVDFIRLTVGRTTTEAEIYKQTRVKLKDYNPDEYSIPWLRVGVTGRILGHNGRHRAAMLLMEGRTVMPVCVIVQAYCLKSRKYVQVPNAELPKGLRGQFLPKVTRETSKVFYPIVWFTPHIKPGD